MNQRSFPADDWRRMLLVLGLLFVAAPVVGDEVSWTADRLFEKGVSEGLRLSEDGAALELAWGELIEDDGPAAGYSYLANEEPLGPGVLLRKTLMIPRPQCREARLLVGTGGTWEASINGYPQEVGPVEKVGNYWQMVSFSPAALVAGRNNIVLNGSGKVWIARAEDFAAGSTTRPEHPNRSARSLDGGRTWDDEYLGKKGDVDGEYYVRMFLDHYRQAGSLTLPVVDAGNLAGAVVGPPVTHVGPIRIRVATADDQHEGIGIKIRTGTTFVPDADHWTDWHACDVPSGDVPQPHGRFLQIRLELTTDDPLRSPQIQTLTVEAHPERPADWTEHLQVVDTDNPAVVRTAIPFRYEPLDHPRLKVLRERYDLDEVVAGAEREFDIITRLAIWSSRQWTKGHLSETYPRWDALDILSPHADGQPVGGFCQQYNLVLLQACASYGIVGRAVSLSPGSLTNRPRRSGHEVVELWSNDYRKWVYVDGDFAAYAVDAETNIPLSLLELRERQLAQFAKRDVRPTRIVRLAETDRLPWTSLDDAIPFAELRLIPRSNFLEAAAPLPLNQGMRGWFWTGHYVWMDDMLPAALLYGNRVTRRGNFEWTLNHAHIVLEATATPGEIRVHLDTETPSFKTFLAQIDDDARHPVASSFLWRLHEGQNSLDVAPQNIADRTGSVSRIVLNAPASIFPAQ